MVIDHNPARATLESPSAVDHEGKRALGETLE